MYTPQAAQRSTKHLAQTSRIPRPHCNPNCVQVDTSPSLATRKKRRHASEPSDGCHKILQSTTLTRSVSDDLGAHKNNVQKEVCLLNMSSSSKKRKHDSGGKRRFNSGKKMKEKAKRRSSFVRGRLSLSVPAMTHEDEVCLEDISEDLPPEERLAQLTRSVLRFSLDKLYAEMADIEGLQQFKVEGLEASTKCIDQLKSDGIFQTAVCTDKVLPNPKNEAVAHTIQELTVYTGRLKKQYDRWEEILQENTENAKFAEKQCAEVADNPITEMPATGFTGKQLKLLSDKPDYNAMLDRLQCYKLHTLDDVNQLQLHVQSLQEIQCKANATLEGYAYNIYKVAFDDIENLTDPQQLILDVLE